MDLSKLLNNGVVQYNLFFLKVGLVIIATFVVFFIVGGPFFAWRARKDRQQAAAAKSNGMADSSALEDNDLKSNINA